MPQKADLTLPSGVVVGRVGSEKKREKKGESLYALARRIVNLFLSRGKSGILRRQKKGWLYSLPKGVEVV